MLSLAWIPEVLALLPAVVAGVVLLTLALALWLPRTRRTKALCALVVAAAWGYLYHRIDSAADATKQRQIAQRQQAQAKFNASRALFEEHCKTAGEKIHKTVDNVDGVVWMKWRPDSYEQYKQFTLDDPYGHDCGGDHCILQLLRVTRDVKKNPEDAHRHRGRYDFVESIDPADGLRYRYTAAMKLRPMWTEEKVRAYEAKTGKPIEASTYWAALDRVPVDRFTARYGITWADLSTRQDREHWIAGSSLKVIDLQTQEVIAERIGYMMDAGQGNTNGGRSPWGHARYMACPAFDRDGSPHPTITSRTTAFIFKTLIRAQKD